MHLHHTSLPVSHMELRTNLCIQLELNMYGGYIYLSFSDALLAFDVVFLFSSMQKYFLRHTIGNGVVFLSQTLRHIYSRVQLQNCDAILDQVLFQSLVP